MLLIYLPAVGRMWHHVTAGGVRDKRSRAERPPEFPEQETAATLTKGKLRMAKRGEDWRCCSAAEPDHKGDHLLGREC